MTKPLPVSPDELRTAPLFAAVPATQLRILSGLMQRQSFPTGAALLTVGQPGRRVYVLQSGTVKVCIARPDGQPASSQSDEDADDLEGLEEGRTIVLNLCGAGELLGEMSAMDGEGCSASVIAIEPCQALWIEADLFRDWVEQVPSLALALLRATQQRLRRATRQLYTHASYEATGRLAAQLLLFADHYVQDAPEEEVRIPLRLVQRDLADVIASSRTSVNTALATLRADGCLSHGKGGSIVIHDRERLASYCR